MATALLRLNELNSNITNGADLIELRVIEAGDIAGITIEQVLTTPVVLATLPSLVVAANDLIVVHLNAPGGVTNEMLTKDQCGGPACYDEAWDVRGEDTGLFFGNRVISVMDGATYQDAVPFIVSCLRNASRAASAVHCKRVGSARARSRCLAPLLRLCHTLSK